MLLCPVKSLGRMSVAIVRVKAALRAGKRPAEGINCPLRHETILTGDDYNIAMASASMANAPSGAFNEW